MKKQDTEKMNYSKFKNEVMKEGFIVAKLTKPYFKLKKGKSYEFEYLNGELCVPGISSIYNDYSGLFEIKSYFREENDN